MKGEVGNLDMKVGFIKECHGFAYVGSATTMPNVGTYDRDIQSRMSKGKIVTEILRGILWNKYIQRN
jgi:hypothetical protein